MSHNRNERFSALDSFRGFAAICVVLYHMRLSISLPKSNFIEHSWIFVEFFFILSGFVLTHSYATRDNLTFKNFVIGRTFRLFPLHYAVFLVIIALELLKLAVSHHGIHFYNAPFEGRNSIKEILPNLLLLQSWLPFSNSLSFNGPSWSLSVEYYVYMIFFCTLFAKKKLRAAVWLAILTTFLLLLVSIEKIGINKYSGAFRGLVCFFSGSLCYLAYDIANQKTRLFKPIVFTILELISLCACAHIVTHNSELKIIIAGLIFTITVFIFSLEKGLVSQILKASLFQLLGKLSYSIYMTHSAVLLCFVFVAALHKKLSMEHVVVRRIDLGSMPLNIMLATIAIITIIALSTITYRYIEKPFQEYAKNLLNKKSKNLIY